MVTMSRQYVIEPTIYVLSVRLLREEHIREHREKLSVRSKGYAALFYLLRGLLSYRKIAIESENCYHLDER